MTNEIKLTTEMIRNGEHQELYEEYAKKKSRNYEDNLIKCELAGYRLYDALDCSPLLRLELGGLTIDSENSEIKYADPYEHETTLYYLAPYVYGTTEELVDKPIELNKDGHLYTMTEFLQAIDNDDISDYDGSCDLLYEKDGQWYASQLDVSIDYPLPEFIKTKYTHAMWYNK